MYIRVIIIYYFFCIGIDDSRKFAECLIVMKQILLHALGVDSNKRQQTQVHLQDGESKQQQEELRKKSSHKYSKTSIPKTAPASQPFSDSTNSSISPGTNAGSLQSSNHKQVAKLKATHYQNPQEPSVVRTPVSKMIQQTPTPTSLASSGIGSLNEEDTTVTHPFKPVPQQDNVGGLLKTEHLNDSGLPPTRHHQHSHRHKRTHSERNMHPHEGGREITKVQHSISDHQQLKSQVQRLTLSVEEEEIR